MHCNFHTQFFFLNVFCFICKNELKLDDNTFRIRLLEKLDSDSLRKNTDPVRKGSDPVRKSPDLVGIGPDPVEKDPVP